MKWRPKNAFFVLQDIHNFPSTTAFIIIPFDDIMVDTRKQLLLTPKSIPFSRCLIGRAYEFGLSITITTAKQ